MRFRALRVAGLAVAASTTGCYRSDPVGPALELAVARVILSPADTTVAAGDSIEFRALLRDSTGTKLADSIAVSWSISDAGVVAITSRGAQVAAVRARAPGNATLAAAVQGKVGQATIVVH